MTTSQQPTDQRIRLHGTAVLVCAADGEPVRTDRDAMDLVAQTFGDDVEWVAVPVARLDPDFFHLRSGVAGTVVQKFVTYQRGLAVVGDVTEHVDRSTAFRDFVRECNRGRQTWFVDDLDELASRLAPTATA